MELAERRMNRALLTLLCFSSAAWCADVKVDNELVRILKAEDPPGSKTPLHRHEFNRVMVYLSDGEQTITLENGRTEKFTRKAGQVVWSAAGPPHVSSNTGTAALRIIEVELKQPAPAQSPMRRAELDPVAIDPAHNVLLFENEQVRVFRSWREAGASEMLHEHTGRGRVVVLLTDIDARMKSGSGAVSEMKAAAGDVLFTPGQLTHAGTNAGQRRFDMVVVEVK